MMGVEAKTSVGCFSLMTVSDFRESERQLGSRVSDKATFWKASGTGTSVIKKHVRYQISKLDII